MTAAHPPATAAPPTSDWRRKARLFAELQDLKRQRPAHLDATVSTVLFRRAWRRLIAGEDLARVAYSTTAEAVTNILLPGCDELFFPAAGFGESATTELLRGALTASAGAACGERTLAQLGGEADGLAHRYHQPAVATVAEVAALPRSLGLLCRQPRAGATRPGFARLVLVPAEMHSDHCLLTAVYAVLSAEVYGADPAQAFLCALAHHLHNALLPDCGFAGELLLGTHLGRVIETGRERALTELPEGLRQNTRHALTFHETIDAPEGRAISAGDVLDRVLDVKWRTRAAAVTDADILDDLDLVHAGPLKDFQTDLLAQTDLWTTP